MPSIRITRTTPIYRSPQETGVFVQWDLEDIDEPGTFTLERSGSPEGGWELVVEHLDDFHFFDDLRGPDSEEKLNYLSLHRNYYYRVRYNAHTSDPTPVGDHLDSRNRLLRRKLLRDLKAGFKFNGVPIVCLKRRHWGARCSVCFDSLTKTVTAPYCEVCYGTSYEGGYWAPVQVRGRLTVTAPQSSLTTQGITDLSQLRLYLADIPVLEPDDIVVHLQQNKRYVVKHRTQTELQTVSVHQVLMVNELPRSTIEYRIPVNTAVNPVVY